MEPIDLQKFEWHLKQRLITIDDYERLVALQQKCFPGMVPWSREQIESQIRIFPEGQLCVEYDGDLVASASSRMVDLDHYGDWHDWREIADSGCIRNRVPEGDTLYGIESVVDRQDRGMKLARRLNDARKELARRFNLPRIIIAGRIPGYGA